MTNQPKGIGSKLGLKIILGAMIISVITITYLYFSAKFDCSEVLETDKVWELNQGAGSSFEVGINTKDGEDLRAYCREGHLQNENKNYMYCYQFETYEREVISAEGIIGKKFIVEITDLVYDKQSCINGECHIIKISCVKMR